MNDKTISRDVPITQEHTGTAFNNLNRKKWNHYSFDKPIKRYIRKKGYPLPNQRRNA